MWEDPSVFALNKRASHVRLHSFREAESAFDHIACIGRTLHPDDAPANKIMLNGMWDFRLYPSAEDVPEDFWMPGHSLQDWGQVRPACHAMASSIVLPRSWHLYTAFCRVDLALLMWDLMPRLQTLGSNQNVSACFLPQPLAQPTTFHSAPM